MKDDSDDTEFILAMLFFLLCMLGGVAVIGLGIAGVVWLLGML